jgi:hypothetical protein
MADKYPKKKPSPTKDRRPSKEDRAKSSSPFDSPRKFAGSAVKGFTPGGSNYPVPAMPGSPSQTSDKAVSPSSTPLVPSKTKPMIIKKRNPNGSASSSPLSKGTDGLASSLPSACPIPASQEEVAASSPLRQSGFSHSSEELRNKSELLLGALRGSPQSSDLAGQNFEAGKLIDHSKSESLKKLLKINLSSEADNSRTNSRKGPFAK